MGVCGRGWLEVVLEARRPHFVTQPQPLATSVINLRVSSASVAHPSSVLSPEPEREQKARASYLHPRQRFSRVCQEFLRIENL